MTNCLTCLHHKTKIADCKDFVRNSRFYQIQRGAYQIMRADGNLRNVFAQHIGGNGNDFVFLVDTDFGRAAVLMNGAHFGNAGGNGRDEYSDDVLKKTIHGAALSL